MTHFLKKAWLGFSIILLFPLSAFATAYWPFNTPICLTSESLPWNKITNSSPQDPSYGIKITNHCAQPLILVRLLSPGHLAVNNFTIFGPSMVGYAFSSIAWYAPAMMASSNNQLPYFASALQLYQDDNLVPVTGAQGNGNNFRLDPNLADPAYYANIILNPNDWFAMNVSPGAIGPAQVNLAGQGIATDQGTVTFDQQNLHLPTHAEVSIDLDFSQTAHYSYLGKYRWNISQYPQLQLPVTDVPYSVEEVHVPTAHDFAWATYTLADAHKKTGILHLQKDRNVIFPDIGIFKQLPAPSLKLTGILGMPFREGGVLDGLNEDINNLNSKLTGVVLAFANLDEQNQPYLEPAHKTPNMVATWQANIQKFQAANHLVFISFGGSSGGTGAMHIVQWALKQIPSSTQCTIADGSCDAILAKYPQLVKQATQFYETIVQRYKPDGIDLDIEGNDASPLGDVFTAKVIAQVMQDVKQDNPNFMLGLTVGAFQDDFSYLQGDLFTAFAREGVTPTYVNGMYMALPLNNWKNLPHCGKPTAMPVLPSAACIWDTIPAYAKTGQYAMQNYWPNQTVLVGITPEALADDADTVEIWPDKNQANQPDQLKAFLDLAQANSKNVPLFIFYWDTRNDFNGGSKPNSYLSNQYQTELADHSSLPYGIQQQK